MQILAAPGAAAGCCALHPLRAELPAWAVPCQGCEWDLSSCLQEPQRNLAFALISLPLVISAELGKRGENRQTDMETVISCAWLPKETWLQIEVRFGAAKGS